MLTPGKYNGFVIYQGASFDEILTWRDVPTLPATLGTPVDLTDYTARMQIRRTITSDEVLVELSTENGGISLGGPDGTIELVISATDTAAMTWTRGVWDLELVLAETVTRLVGGRIKVSPEVTR